MIHKKLSSLLTFRLWVLFTNFFQKLRYSVPWGFGFNPWLPYADVETQNVTDWILASSHSVGGGGAGHSKNHAYLQRLRTGFHQGYLSWTTWVKQINLRTFMVGWHEPRNVYENKHGSWFGCWWCLMWIGCSHFGKQTKLPAMLEFEVHIETRDGGATEHFVLWVRAARLSSGWAWRGGGVRTPLRIN